MGNKNFEVFLLESHWGRLREFLERAYPEEGCGLFLGEKGPNTFKVKEIYPTRNAWERAEDRRRRYLINPLDFLKAEKKALAQGLDLIGIYHSHPDYPPFPSEFDYNSAWEGYFYLIAQIEKGKFKEAKVFYFYFSKNFREMVLIVIKEG